MHRLVAGLGVVVIIGGVVLFVTNRSASAAPAPTGTPSPSDALSAKVQQERQAELAQWQIVARTAGRVLQDIDNSAPNPPLRSEMQARYDAAQTHITQLEAEIAAHGG